MTRVVSFRLVAAFGLAVILLVVNAIVSVRSTNTLIENNDLVVHTQTVIEAIAEAMTAITTAESAQRGYIITGDPEMLEIYRRDAPAVEASIRQLKELTGDNPQQAQRVLDFEHAVAVRRKTLDENLELSERGAADTLIRDHRLLLGRDQMAEVRRLVKEMQEEEDRLLKIRTEQSTESARNTIITFGAANALVLALLIVVYYLVVRDMAERKRAADALQDARDQLEVRVKERTAELADANTELERSNRELQDFAFVASHDLQEPLRKIQAFGDRLKTRHGAELNEQAQDYLARMQGAAGRMHTLINDLLTFSRVTTKAQPFVPTDLNRVVNEVLGDLEVRVADSGGRVETGDLPTIDADPLQMRQLFQNLIGNALKFHREGVPPIIKIRSDASAVAGAPGNCEFTVEDNGIGFDEKYLDRIFTPFQRLHGRGEYEGTGIGLAVCRKIVERHGGTLTANSTPGEGSTFIITLPINQEKEKPRSEKNGTADHNSDG